MHREWDTDYTFSKTEGIKNKLEDFMYKVTYIPTGETFNQLIYVKDRKRLVALIGHWNRSSGIWKYEIIG